MLHTRARLNFIAGILLVFLWVFSACSFLLKERKHITSQSHCGLATEEVQGSFVFELFDAERRKIVEPGDLSVTALDLHGLPLADLSDSELRAEEAEGGYPLRVTAKACLKVARGAGIETLMIKRKSTRHSLLVDLKAFALDSKSPHIVPLVLNEKDAVLNQERQALCGDLPGDEAEESLTFKFKLPPASPSELFTFSLQKAGTQVPLSARQCVSLPRAHDTLVISRQGGVYGKLSLVTARSNKVNLIDLDDSFSLCRRTMQADFHYMWDKKEGSGEKPLCRLKTYKDYAEEGRDAADTLLILEEISNVIANQNSPEVKYLATNAIDLYPLISLPLRRLKLSNPFVKDLDPLRFMPDLQILEARKTLVKDLKPLKDLKNIEVLDLAFTSVEDISDLSQFKKLRKLYLRKTKITDITALKDCHDLEFLDLAQTAVSDISGLQNLKQLKVLNLSETAVADTSALAGAQNLQVLNLEKTRVETIEPLKNLKNIEKLNLNRCKIVDLQPLSELTALEELELQETLVSDLLPLTKHVKMKVLDLKKTPVQDLRPIEGLSRLTNLDLGHTKIATIDALKTMGYLQTLEINHTKVKDLLALSGCEVLMSLDLSETEISDLGPVAKLINLQYLNISSTPVKNLSALQKLDQLFRVEAKNTTIDHFSGLQAHLVLY